MSIAKLRIVVSTIITAAVILASAAYHRHQTTCDTVTVAGAFDLHSTQLSFRRFAKEADSERPAMLRLTYQLTENPHHVVWFDISLSNPLAESAHQLDAEALTMTVVIPEHENSLNDRMVRFKGIDGQLQLQHENNQLSGSFKVQLRSVSETKNDAKPTMVHARFSQVAITSA